MDFKQIQGVEVLDKRQEKSKTFDKGNGKFTLISSQTPLHYFDSTSNTFEDIDLTIDPLTKKLEKNIYKLELTEDKIGYSIVNRKDNSRIDVKLSKIGNNEIPYSEPVIQENRVIWKDLDKDFDLIIECRAKKVRVWKHFKTADATTDITFTVIEDDNPAKELHVIDKLLGKDSSGKSTKSSQIKGIETKKTTIVTKKNVKEYTLRQTFDKKVIVKDKKTRVKSLSSDVTYPVMIDADVEVGIGVTNNDGTDFYQSLFGVPGSGILTTSYINGIVNVYNSDFGGNPIKILSNVFTRFDGITIPQSATIDNAILNLYGANSSYGGAPFGIYAIDENDPNAPTAPGDIRNKTTGIASNVVTTIFTNTTTTQTKDQFILYDIDVSSIVQELVNSYDYSNEAMLFFYRQPNIITFFQGGEAIYDYTWGSTKAPTLVINYTEAATGWPHNLNGVANANIGKVNGILLSNISKINGVE